jgi:hypothetical protein
MYNLIRHQSIAKLAKKESQFYLVKEVADGCEDRVSDAPNSIQRMQCIRLSEDVSKSQINRSLQLLFVSSSIIDAESCAFATCSLASRFALPPTRLLRSWLSSIFCTFLFNSFFSSIRFGLFAALKCLRLSLFSYNYRFKGPLTKLYVLLTTWSSKKSRFAAIFIDHPGNACAIAR